MSNNKIIKIEKIVKELLILDKHLRDDDQKLYGCVVYNIMPEVAKEDFITVMMSGKAPTMESVTRCRRKLQATYPELRGTVWQKRHEKEEEYEAYNRGELQ